MGEVYRATDSHLKRSVAIKVLPAVMAGDADRLARFKIPKYVRLVSEFPMTASGKIQKYKLREQHQNSLAS